MIQLALIASTPVRPIVHGWHLQIKIKIKRLDTVQLPEFLRNSLEINYNNTIGCTKINQNKIK